MGFETYNRDIPDAPNNPSADQGLMKTNTNAIDNLIDVDHFSFNDNLGGYHKQVTFVEEVAPGIGTGDAVLFGGANSSNTWPHWQNSLATVLMLNGVPSNATNGYTYLPGGILLQWGVKPVANSAPLRVIFPIPFNGSPYSVIPNVSAAVSGIYATVSSATPPSSTQFFYVLSVSAPTPLYWIAIGSA